MANEQRSQFATKVGILAATVGSAVGLGNVWRFPFEAGTHGGGAFLLIYIICVALIGIPVICAEFVIGRGTHKNTFGAFRTLHQRKIWRYASCSGILASLMILSFYSVVAGWTLSYLIEAVSGNMTTGSTHDFAAEFTNFVASPWLSPLCAVALLAINYVITVRGIRNGIERISNCVMPILAIILIVLLFNAATLPGFREGLQFLFAPDFSQITPGVILGAMGQAFFSLSLGLGCLLTYSSYFSDSTPLIKNAVYIAVLDTAVAIVAGIIVFSAVFSYDTEPTAGPKLVFEVLPNIFNGMPGGYIWAVLFFLLLLFASITSTISMSEISIAFFAEECSMSRKWATRLTTGIAIVFGVICALSFGALSHFTILGMTIFEAFDYMSSNVLLPFGGILFAVFVGWKAERKFVEYQLTADKSRATHCGVHVVLFLIRYIAPIAISLIFLSVIGILG